MSRRRGVVLSDDESTPTPRQPRPALSTRKVSRQDSSRASSRTTAAAKVDYSDYPEVAKIENQQLELIRQLIGMNPNQLNTRLTAVMSVLADTAVAVEELEVSDENKDTVARLEKSFMDVIDAKNHLKNYEGAVPVITGAAANAEGPVALHELFNNEVRKRDAEYNSKSPEEKYANIAEYQDFKRRVWDIHHPNQPEPSSWFTLDATTGRGGTANADDDDEDIVMGAQIQSLKCPITLTLLENPVRNDNCPHVYSLDAIKELVRQGRGHCKCPVAGCSAVVTMKGVREDKVMARKVREERKRIEEREQEGRAEVQEVGEDSSMMIDEDVKFEA